MESFEPYRRAVQRPRRRTSTGIRIGQSFGRRPPKASRRPRRARSRAAAIDLTVAPNPIITRSPTIRTNPEWTGERRGLVGKGVAYNEDCKNFPLGGKPKPDIRPTNRPFSSYVTGRPSARRGLRIVPIRREPRLDRSAEGAPGDHSGVDNPRKLPGRPSLALTDPDGD